MLRSKVFIILFLAGFSVMNAQKYEKYLGIQLGPAYDITLFKANSEPVRGYQDSVKEMIKNRVGLSVGAIYITKLKRDLSISAGFQVRWLSTSREYAMADSNAFGYKSPYHPEVPVISDLSQTWPKTIDFRFRFLQIQLPIIFNWQVGGTSTKLKPSWHLSAGAIGSFVLQHNGYAEFKGWYVEGKNKFHFSETGFNESQLNFILLAGIKYLYPFKTNIHGYAQPNFQLPIMPYTTGQDQYRFFSFGINVGLVFDLNKPLKGEETKE